MKPSRDWQKLIHECSGKGMRYASIASRLGYDPSNLRRFGVNSEPPYSAAAELLALHKALHEMPKAIA